MVGKNGQGVNPFSSPFFAPLSREAHTELVRVKEGVASELLESVSVQTHDFFAPRNLIHG